MTVAASECPRGSGKMECTCVRGSEPCYGLDEAACQSLSFCIPVYGVDEPAGDFTPSDVDAASPISYLGCHTKGSGDNSGFSGETCCHPVGVHACKSALDSLIPDGWVGCTGCDCAWALTPPECPTSSYRFGCCCAYPASNPCEGSSQAKCDFSDGMCSSVHGYAWNPSTGMPTGPEVYVGCHSNCPPRVDGGAPDAGGTDAGPTCVHAPGQTECFVANGSVIPDSWSTDCSACTLAPPPDAGEAGGG